MNLNHKSGWNEGCSWRDMNLNLWGWNDICSGRDDISREWEWNDRYSQARVGMKLWLFSSMNGDGMKDVLGEILDKIENILTHWSGVQADWNDEKHGLSL